jgi:hypothetical protein
MRAWILIAFVGLACSDPDPLTPKPTDDGCNGCTLEQPVQVTGLVGIDGVVRVANEADGTLKVRIDEAISVRGPVEITGTVNMLPPDEPIPVVISGTVPMTGSVTITPSADPLAVALETPETPLPITGVVAIAPPEQPLPVSGAVTVRNEPGDALAVRVEGTVTVAEPVAVTLPDAPLAVNGSVVVRNPPGNALAVRVEGTVTVDEPVAITLPDAPIRCIIENNGNQQGPLRGTLQGATYKGATQTLRAGNAGIGTLNADCHTAFPGSRICTDQEILFNSFPVPTMQTDAWIFMRSVGGGHSGVQTTQTNAGRIWDGRLLTNQNCRLFQDRSQIYSGIVFTVAGSLGSAQCDEERVVACCGV